MVGVSALRYVTFVGVVVVVGLDVLLGVVVVGVVELDVVGGGVVVDAAVVVVVVGKRKRALAQSKWSQLDAVPVLIAWSRSRDFPVTLMFSA
jgi:hypothetical protein